jgi:hypothetical protein
VYRRAGDLHFTTIGIAVEGGGAGEIIQNNFEIFLLHSKKYRVYRALRREWRWPKGASTKCAGRYISVESFSPIVENHQEYLL